METNKCQICGCTDSDCRNCIERTGEPCHWVDEEQTLCSACVKVFKRFPPDQIPPQSTDEFRKESEISDRYFAMVIGLDEEPKMSLIAWDFRNQKWKSPLAGKFTVIEYYESI